MSITAFFCLSVIMETGKCACGCGETTNTAKQSDTKRKIVKGQYNKFITGHQLRGRSGKISGSWRGGTYTNDAGYVMITKRGHHRTVSNGYVREHIVIAEKALGEKLPEGCQVHHHGDIADNSKIVICQDQEYHYLLHIRAKALMECGDANKRKCKFCKQYDDVDNLHCRQIKTGKKGWNVYHLSCARVYDRKRYAEGRIR